MRYMGSKARYAKDIVPILQAEIDKIGAKTYIECFVGGANIIDKIKCEQRIGYDRSDTLIALLRQASEDFSKVLKEDTKEMWDKAKLYVRDGKMPEDMTLAEIGAIEFFRSFSNGGFPRGRATDTPTRHYFQEAYRNLEEQAPNLKNIVFQCQEYQELDPNLENCVIYLDPPYQGTTQYGYARFSTMNYDDFWNWVRQISKKNSVFISEQQAPDDFDIVWEKQVRRTVNTENDFKTTEKLYKYHG